MESRSYSCIFTSMITFPSHVFSLFLIFPSILWEAIIQVPVESFCFPSPQILMDSNSGLIVIFAFSLLFVCFSCFPFSVSFFLFPTIPTPLLCYASACPSLGRSLGEGPLAPQVYPLLQPGWVHCQEDSCARLKHWSPSHTRVRLQLPALKPLPLHNESLTTSAHSTMTLYSQEASPTIQWHFNYQCWSPSHNTVTLWP